MNVTGRAAVLVAALSLPLHAVPVQAQEPLELTLENIHHNSTGVYGVAVAPAGDVAAVTARGDEGGGIYRLALDEPGAEPVFWLEGGSPTWTPDGDRLVFLREGALWAVGRDGGEPTRLTPAMQGLRDPAVSPDGGQVAFYSTESGHQDVWLVPTDGTGEPRQLTEGSMTADDSRFAASWSPSGDRIAFVSNRRDYWEDDLYVVDVASGDVQRLTWSLMAASDPVWSPSGDRIVMFGTAKHGYWYEDLADVYIVDPDEPRSERILEMQVWASDQGMRNEPIWSGAGDRIYFPYLERGELNLWAVPDTGGVATRVTHVGGSMRSFDATGSADAFYFVRSAPEHGRELYRIRASGGPAERLTRMSPVWEGTQTPTEISYQSWDGTYIQGFLYTPPQVEEGAVCPSLVQVHGGGTNSYTLGQNLTEQYLASEGFVVLAINYRGGSGFGRAFQDLGVEDWLNGQAKDPAPAADWLRARGYTTDAVGIYGGSYGGMQSMAAITRTPDAFDAAVPMRGVYSEALTFDDQDRVGKIFTATGHGGLPEERPEIYEKSETLARFDRIQAPVLVMHGEEDVRAAFRNYELAVERLEELGKEYEAVSYPGEGHGFSDPANRIDMYRRLTDWFRTHLGGCR